MKFSVKLEDIVKNPTIYKENGSIIKVGYKKITRKKSGVKEYVTVEILSPEITVEEINHDNGYITEPPKNEIILQKQKNRCSILFRIWKYLFK